MKVLILSLQSLSQFKSKSHFQLEGFRIELIMANSKIIILLIISSLSIGWFAGRYTAPSPESIVEEEIEIKRPIDPVAEVNAQKLRQLQEKLLEIEKVDLAEYYELKDKKEQYLKANEILGKVMLILLADLGLHLSRKNWEGLAKIEAPPLEPPPSPKPAPEKEKREEQKPFSRKEEFFENPFTKKMEEKKKLAKVMDRKNRLHDPSGFFRESTPFREINPLFQKIMGSYWGDMIYTQEDKVEVLEFQANFDHNGKEYEGDSTIIIYDINGNPRSRSRGSGKNNSFQSNPNDPNGIVIETSPKSFIHLTYNERKKQFSGFYYAIPGGKKEYKLTAKIPRLKRR